MVDSIGFDTMGSEEDQNQNSDSESVDFEGYSELNEYDVALITKLMNSKIRSCEVLCH